MSGLIEEPPILVYPSLAARIGLNQAVLIQQIHWWSGRRSAVEIDGVRWLKVDISWLARQLPFWSEATVRRVVKDLTARGLIRAKRGAESNVYSIDYAALEALQIDCRRCQIDRCSRERDDGPTTEREERELPTARAVDEAPATLFPSAQTEVQPDPIEPKVQKVWLHYFGHFGDKLSVKALTPARSRTLRGALKATDDDPDVCCKAVDGFKRYRQGKPGGMGLDDIFKSRPGGSSLTELIEFWVSQADDSPTMSSAVPAILRDKVSRRRLTVVEALQRPEDSAARERARDAVQWLAEHAKERPVIEDGKVVRWEQVS